MSDDLQAKLTKLRLLQAQANNDDIRADYADRIAELEAQLRAKTQHMEASSITNSKQINAEHYYEGQPDSTAERSKLAFAQYLRHLRETCDVLALANLDSNEALARDTIKLSQVYVGLDTLTEVMITASQKENDQSIKNWITTTPIRDSRPMTALEAVLHEPRLILLGKPGSGKSTFVDHLTLCLAGASLHRNDPEEPAPPDGWLSYLPKWPENGIVPPVKIVLREWAADERIKQATSGSLKLFTDFLRDQLMPQDCAEAFDFILAALREGRALLLLDGWDEVVGEHTLRMVRESIVEIARSFKARIVVTCRVLDYEAEPLRQLPGFRTHTLADFNDEQVKGFIEAWYSQYMRVRQRPAADATNNTTRLQGAIAELPDELRDLAGSPLLLTVMAIVHANRGRLPDARALLYDECIKILLLRWRQPKGQPDLLKRLELPADKFRDADLEGMMADLGYAAHVAADRDQTNPRRPADLDETAVMAVLARGFSAFDAARKQALAGTMLHALAMGNGLLLKRGPDTYAFPHRSFQEFLAGQHIAVQSSRVALCRAYASQIHWHETLLLMIGYEVFKDRPDVGPAINLVRDLLDREPLSQVLAGEVLALVSRERATKYDPELLAPRGLWSQMCGRLLALATAKTGDLTPPLRARAGRALGRLVFDSVEALTQPVVAIPAPDLRLPLALVGIEGGKYEQHPRWREALDRYWCHVGAGPFWYGDDNKQLKQVKLNYGFNIGRYPVTNAEYARFLAAPDYADDRWWTEGARARYRNGPPSAPQYWDENRFNNPLQPVVGVSWYEATAYCRWLTAQGQAAGWLPAQAHIRLPTSLEWERAARHTDQRRYPWGTDPPTPEHANYADTGIGAPAPVGCFPLGDARCGASDLVGNVLEWLATPYEQANQLEASKDFTPSDRILITWSYYGDSTDELHCGSRYSGNPFCRYSNLGFRCCMFLGSSG